MYVLCRYVVKLWHVACRSGALAAIGERIRTSVGEEKSAAELRKMGIGIRAWFEGRPGVLVWCLYAVGGSVYMYVSVYVCVCMYGLFRPCSDGRLLTAEQTPLDRVMVSLRSSSSLLFLET
ncbi:hypothetical protein LX32DRAFT_284172 [Colletotrichum zoysiae]|uniref:Uncharacterized protein n=1 Tax=Colletotrichum zoysiae TaxID=1216348 RepID=A0AAD9M456_9PEZI|nr:hypothetical protein LX32DRAFT_284172 [Colletotrichum zoysiae]